MLRPLSTILTVVAATMLLISPMRIQACTCLLTFLGLPPCGAYWDASAVFTGRVTDISVIPLDLGDGLVGYKQKLVRFSIEESFRGTRGRSVEILTGMGGGDCGYDFKQGERYFVYAYSNPNNSKLHVGICGRTQPLSEASSDLDYARAVKSGKTGSIIHGIVLRYTRDAYVDYGQHNGIKGINIFVEGNGRRFNLITDDEGRFQMYGLPAGTYKVRAELPLNLPKASEQQVVIPEGRCAGAEFLTTSLSTIRGKLLDSEGRPAATIDIKLIPADTEGKEELWRGREISSYTDEEGYYEFGGIPAGRYVIVINYEGAPGQFDPPFPRTYYPGTSELTKAGTFTISEGEEIEASEFRLPPRLVERTIEGIVVLPDGKPAAGAWVGIELTERRWLGQGTSADDQGRFALKCFEGYRYLVQADHDSVGKRMHAVPVEILVTSENQPVKLVITKPGGAPYSTSDKRKAH